MRHYRFALRRNGSPVEELGGIALATEDEALDFGQQLAQDLVRYAEIAPPLIVEILAADRTVASISFHAATPSRSN